MFKLTKNLYNYNSGKNKIEIDNELTRVSAYSYSWWQYITTDSVGNVYFNNSKYSNTTSRHQGEAARILHSLGIHVDVWLENTTEHFGRHENPIKNVTNAEIKALLRQVESTANAILKRGSKKLKNAERVETIKTLKYRIKDLERIRDEYVDKKRIPRPKLKTLQELIGQDNGGIDRYIVRQINRFKVYFKKQNGKVQRNEFAAFLNKIHNDYGFHTPPTRDQLKVLQRLLELKPSDSIEFILTYHDAKDIPGMLPHEDSAEYLVFKTWINKSLKGHPKNPLLLEKIHQKLVNIQNKRNKRNYVPREAEVLPMHPNLVRLEGTKGLQLIKTDRELRAEGKRQGHCIGSKQYLEKLRMGYNAANFHGYTFFLDPELRIVETRGRHNCLTPETVQEKFERLISKGDA